MRVGADDVIALRLAEPVLLLHRRRLTAQYRHKHGRVDARGRIFVWKSKSERASDDIRRRIRVHLKLTCKASVYHNSAIRARIARQFPLKAKFAADSAIFELAAAALSEL